jgi:hypothetical protein
LRRFGATKSLWALLRRIRSVRIPNSHWHRSGGMVSI